MMDNIGFDLVGKVLEQDIVSENDVLLLKKGVVLTSSNIELLRKHHYKTVKVSEKKTFEDLYLTHINRIQELFTNLDQVKTISIKGWFNQDQNIVNFVQSDASILDKIYTINKANDIYRHSANVGLIAFFLGKLLRYSYKNKLLLWQMGVLHDIGKMKLSPEILKNNKSLTAEQNQQYQKHPEYSWSILKELSDINVKILNGVRNHRERIDGSGYPRRLAIKYLHVSVQIISVADLIDEFMSEEKNNTFDLIDLLMNEILENKLSPAVVIPFIRHMLRKYVGKRVILNNKREGEIVFVFDHEPSQPLLYFRETDTFMDLRKFNQLKIVDFA